MTQVTSLGDDLLFRAGAARSTTSSSTGRAFPLVRTSTRCEARPLDVTWITCSRESVARRWYRGGRRSGKEVMLRTEPDTQQAEGEVKLYHDRCATHGAGEVDIEH